MTDEEIKNWLSLKLLKKRDKNLTFEISQKDSQTGDLFSDFKFKKKITREDREWIDRELGLIKKYGAEVIPIETPHYPEPLKHIHNPPALLYVLGNLPSGDLSHVAIVGTRKASHYGLSTSETLARELASSGVVIVSGGARGCDTYAHKGALAGSGLTIAVLGTGLDITYPRENEKLFEEITEKGAIVTEFSFGTPPLPQNFPARNRIINGLSRGVIVAEAPIKSGAMMTARMALDEGRDVFAVPGKTTSDKSSGTNKLIKDGAMLVDSSEDILNAYGMEVREIVGSGGENKNPLSKEEIGLIEIVNDEPVHIDSLIKKTNFTIQKLSYILLDMELRGLIKQLPGKHYVKS